MRLLVLGGTRFLSRAVAEHAVTRGHEVTCACRGRCGSVPVGATHLPWDRDEPAPDALTALEPDAVVDVSSRPSQVRRAVAVLPEPHWVYVSSISAYADHAAELHEPAADDADLAEHPEAYGPMKVACEQAVTSGTASSVVVRPGLVVGPGDPTGRFTYWPERLARGGEVLAPGDPDDGTQVVDVRDLAAWLVLLAEQRTTGTFEAVGEPQPIRDLLARCARGVGAEATLTWADQAFLLEHEVQPWAGPRSLPLFLPRPEYDAMTAHDPGPAVAAGLRLRPVEETAADTLAWARTAPGEADAARTGLTPTQEAEVLAAWRERLA